MQTVIGEQPSEGQLSFFALILKIYMLNTGGYIMILFVEEKPSVAREIADVLGADKKEDGYITGNKYIVS